ncbi:MAG TPA: helix-turn-helix domain-containing protein [Kiritimatiellia bacterium]|nr:helix-turn-helix domain-containing protein [Kiritimatiellia bacterium]HNR93405.1 helix-turn-helix domain-containing protein [Kiritimatiellia bacterium]HNS80315.1 helix-turn-helix domain-containing protein [Kiritimatiellia bacterium]HPA77219.1 helix-turn-helix domain-containing protein [Kiritimatiellia bacterium]HQQ04567.1 helix-turn-helix domain-containing protein [Kiritimatiellia bacterium]
MPRIGQIFRESREKKGVTASQAAQATRMKVQTVQHLENNDFGKIAAPAYVKGFIRLYAEYLGLDPAPLIREYLNGLGETRSPIAPPVKTSPWRDVLKKAAGRLSASLKKISPAVWIKLAGAAVLLLLAWSLLLGISAAVRRKAAGEPPSEEFTARPEAASGFLEDIPEPYWDVLDPSSRPVQDGAAL